MVGAVVQRDLHVDDGESGQNAGLHRAADALLDRRNEFLRDRAADGGVDELKALAALIGFDSDLDMAVLALAAGLTRVLGLLIDLLANGLFVGDLRRTDVCLDLELPQEAVNDDLQMKLTHAGDDRLAGLFIGVGFERGILFGELGKRDAHLFLTGLRLRLDRHADDRLGEDHVLENDGMLFVAERITGRGILQADGRGDIAGIHNGQILSVVRVHEQNSAHPLALILVGVEDGLACFQRTGIHAEERQLANVGIRHDLEGQGGERRVVRRLARLVFLSLRVDAGNCFFVQRGRHILDNRIQQFLNALILVRGAAGDRNGLVGDGRLAQRGADHLFGDVLALKIQRHDLVVLFRDRLEHVVAVAACELLHICGDLFLAHVLTELIIEDIGPHLDEIDHAAEGIFASDGQLDGNGVTLESLVHHLQDIEEIGTHHVHLVHVNKARDMILVGLSPYSLGLRLNAALGAQDRHSAVEHTQGALDLDREVHMTRGVDDVDPHALPVTGGSSRGDRDAALLLLLHPVHGGGTLMGLTESVIDTGVEQNTLSRRRFACIDVCHDANISRILK